MRCPLACAADRRGAGRIALLVAALIGFGAEARAHLVPVAGMVPFVEDGALVGGGTTWGIVRADDDGVFRRVCEEALGIPTTFLRMDDGRVLVGRSSRGLIATENGCTNALVTGLEGHVVSALVRVPSSPGRVLATTATTGLANGVFASDDGGRSFTPTGLQEEGRLFYQLLASDDAELVVAAGLDTTTQAVVLAVSTDGGNTFAPPAADLDDYAYLRLLAIDATGAVLLSAVDNAGGNHLLRSEDALVSVSVLADFDGPLLGFAEAGGARLVLVRSQTEGKRVYRQPSPDVPFAPVDGGPRACLMNLPGDTRAWGCGEDGQEAHFYVSDDGATWEALLPFDAVVERCCAEGTPGLEQCAAYLEDLEADGGPQCLPEDGSDDDGGGGASAEQPPTCACLQATSRPRGVMLGLLSLVGLVRLMRGGRAKRARCP